MHTTSSTTSGTPAGMATATGPLSTSGNDAIEILLNDHTIITSLLDDLTHASDTTTRVNVLARLKAALIVHNATEENLVYPALAVVAGKKSEAEHLYHETAEASQVVFTIDSMLASGATADVQAQADTLRAAILEHIEDEEQKAFPHLRKHASPDQSQLLTASVREFRASLQFTPPGR